LVNKYKEDFIEIKGFKLHYLMWGERGPPIVILHSMGMDAHGFDIFSKAISDEYRVLAITILGHGDSEKPSRLVGLEEHAALIHDVFNSLGFTGNVLIGHSVGGMLGMILAARYPRDIKGLVLVDIAPFDRAAMRGRRRPRPEVPDSFANEDELITYLRNRYPKFTEEAYQNRVKYAFKKGPNGLIRFKGLGDTIRPSLETDLWPYIEQIKTPTLLLIAGDGFIVTNSACERMQSSIPQFDTKTIIGATHMIPQDKPAEFEDTVRKFLLKIFNS
jgi:pimeloyl-ACP methyl ester carboxylesterase